MESSGSLRLSAEVHEAMDCYLIRPHFDLVPLRPVTIVSRIGQMCGAGIIKHISHDDNGRVCDHH